MRAASVVAGAAIALQVLGKVSTDKPTIICGDLNADTEDIPIVHDLIEEQSWKDAGAWAHLWGGSEISRHALLKMLRSQPEEIS